MTPLGGKIDKSNLGIRFPYYKIETYQNSPVKLFARKKQSLPSSLQNLQKLEEVNDFQNKSLIENFKEIKVERNFDDQRFKMKKRPPFDKEVEISYPVTVESICSGKKKKVIKSTNVLKSGKDEP